MCPCLLAATGWGEREWCLYYRRIGFCILLAASYMHVVCITVYTQDTLYYTHTAHNCFKAQRTMWQNWTWGSWRRCKKAINTVYSCQRSVCAAADAESVFDITCCSCSLLILNCYRYRGALMMHPLPGRKRLVPNVETGRAWHQSVTKVRACV